MDLARVVGTVVCARQNAALEGVQLCVLQPVDEKFEAAGEPLVASESATSRRVGDIVYFVPGGDAVYTHPDGRALPVDAAIVGKVEALNLSRG